MEIYIFFQQKTWFRGVQNTSSSFFVAKGTFFFSPGIKEQKLAILISPLLEPPSNQEEKNASHSGLARKSEKYFLYCAQVLYCSESFVKSDRRSKVTKHQVMQSFRGSSFAPLVDLCNMIFKSKMQPELHQSPSEPSLHLTFFNIFFTSPTYASRNSKTLKNIIV